jgi:hypothetical protein
MAALIIIIINVDIISAVGRIVGGTNVPGTGIFPWQLSLATGFLGFFYQHRYILKISPLGTCLALIRYKSAVKSRNA